MLRKVCSFFRRIAVPQKLASLLIFTALCVASPVCMAQEGSRSENNRFAIAGISNPSGVSEFLQKLQRAVAADDRQKVISMVAFPVPDSRSGQQVMISNAEELSKRYDQVFTAHTKQVLARQTEADLHVDDLGVAIGSGEIWFNQAPGKNEFRVVGFNAGRYIAAAISLGDGAKVEAFLIRLKEAVQQDRRDEVASMIKYPLAGITINGHSKTIRNSAQFVEEYEAIITPFVREELAASTVGQLKALEAGVMITPHGAIWGYEVGPAKTMKITSISNTRAK